MVSSCKSYLDEGRYTWCHNSLLFYLAKTFSSFSDCLLYADLPSFLSPSVITGVSLRPDVVLISNNSTLYILELTLGFEYNIQTNSDRKSSKYSSLLLDLKHAYSDVKFTNLSMSTLGIMGKSSESLLLMFDDLKLDKTAQKHVIKKITNIAIRSSYYNFCRRNKSWANPDLMDF